MSEKAKNIWDVIVSGGEMLETLRTILTDLNCLEYLEVLEAVYAFQRSGYEEAVTLVDTLENIKNVENVIEEDTLYFFQGYILTSRVEKTDFIKKVQDMRQSAIEKFMNKNWWRLCNKMHPEYFECFETEDSSSYGEYKSSSSKWNATGISSRRFNKCSHDNKSDKDNHRTNMAKNLHLLRNSMRQRNANSGKAPAI